MYMSAKQAERNGGFQTEEYGSYAQKEKSRELSVRDVVGRFRKRRRNRRMVDIGLRKVC